jgi:hypothetical protein
MKSIDQRLAWTARQWQGHTLTARHSFPSTAADLQARFAIHPVYAFVIGHQALTGDQRVQPAIPVSRPHGGMGLEPRR